jgi:hypothetical protein
MAFGTLLIDWLLLGENSPFNDYFLFHTSIPNAWRSLNLLPYLLSLLIALPLGAANREGLNSAGAVIGFVVTFAFWFLVGYFIVLPFYRVVREGWRGSRAST